MYGRNLHDFRSKKHQSYEDCNKWCSENIHCAGYTVYHKTCYFKGADCKKDLFPNAGRITFIKGKRNLVWLIIISLELLFLSVVNCYSKYHDKYLRYIFNVEEITYILHRTLTSPQAQILEPI